MPPKLYYHPLASFCWKALIALYENRTPFEPVIVDLMDEASAAAFRAVWPMAKFPVLRDEARDRTVAESTIVIEYLDAYYPGATRFLPADPDLAWRVRMLGPLVRSLCPPADAEDRDGPAAPRGAQ